MLISENVGQFHDRGSPINFVSLREDEILRDDAVLKTDVVSLTPPLALPT
jgi:hypothetical protein